MSKRSQEGGDANSLWCFTCPDTEDEITQSIHAAKISSTRRRRDLHTETTRTSHDKSSALHSQTSHNSCHLDVMFTIMTNAKQPLLSQIQCYFSVIDTVIFFINIFILNFVKLIF